MNQIYACPKGTLSPSGIVNTRTANPSAATRSVSLLSKLLMGVFVFLVFGAGKALSQTVVTYNASGNFVVPPGVTQITFDVTGAGGGGAGSGAFSGGGGGGGGSFTRYVNVPVTPGATINIVIGAGGIAGVLNTAGGSGGLTSVSVGGINHAGAAGGQIVVGGSGGGPTGGGNQGGVGGDATLGQPGGGGGGGAATLGVNGVAGGVGVATGGAGGAVNGGNGGNNGFPGIVGLSPGGGGGGGGFGAFGAAGGDGQVVLMYTCATYTVPAFGPFCQGGASQPITGNGVAPGGTSALPGLSPLFVQNVGPTLSGTNVTGSLALGFSFTPTTPGNITVTYAYANPNPNPEVPPCVTTTTRDVVVFPTSVVLNVPANTCATGLTVTPVTPVAGFTQQWSFDGGVTWQNSNVGPTTPGCYQITSRYIKNGAFGNVADMATSPCANSAAVQAVVFPAAPTLANATNTCATALTLPTIPTVAGFNSTYEIITPAGGGGGVWLTPANAQTALNAATPGCWAITGRYELAAACGGTPAGATNACPTSPQRNGVVFPATPALANATNVCNGPLTLPTITTINGFTSTYEIITPTGGGAGTWLTAAAAQIALNAATPGCWGIRGRYELTAACGTAAAANATGTGLCGPSVQRNGVVFPATPAIAAPGNTCVAPLTLPAVANVPGFNTTYEIINPGGGGGGVWLTPVAAQAALNAATPGCWSIRARYELAAACGTAAAAGATGTGACGPTPTVNGVVFPQPVMNVITPTCSPAGFTPTMPAVAGFTQQFSNDGGATWYAGASPVSNAGCYTVIGRYVLAATCGGTLAGATGPCANSAPVNVIIYPVAPTIFSPATTCEPTQFTLPAVPDQSPDFTTEWSIVPTGNAPVWLFNSPIPTTPGVYDVRARYVNSAICGTIAAGTAGPACSQTNTVTATINSVPVVTVIPNQAPVCCNAVVGPFNFTLANAPMLPPGGVTSITWTNSNPAIGLGAAGVGNIPAFNAACNPTTQFATITVTATYTNAGQTCTSAPMAYTITVHANTTGVIQAPANTTICAGQPGNVNVTLTGTPTFNGSFNILNNTTLANTTLNWNSNAPAGATSIPIPTGSLPNTTNTPITYTISWISLTDANCTATSLSGATNITVNPLPAIVITRTGGVGPICPGTTVTYTVASAPGNTVPTTYNYTIVATPSTATSIAAGFPMSGTNVALGSFNVTMPACPYNGTITFSATPFATQAPNCQGPNATPNVVAVNDITPPSFVQPNPTNVAFQRCDAAITGATGLGFVPTPVTTTCGGTTTLGPVTQTFVQSGGCGNGDGTYAAGETGTITRTWVATEPCGATATFTQTIVISDNILPTWVTPTAGLNVTLECGASTAAALATMPVATDGCGPVPTVNLISTTPFAPGACPNSGVIVQTYNAVDCAGNVTNPLFTKVITIQDTQGPVFGNVPASTNLNIGAGAGCTVPLPNYVTLAGFVTGGGTVQSTTTDCGGAISFTQSPVAGTLVTGLGGSIVVTITATDVCGNSRQRTFTVNFVDNTAPTCTVSGAGTINVDLNAAGTATITPATIGAGGVDNCPGGVTFSVTPTTVTCANVGTVFVTLTTTDASGNQTVCGRNVTVRDLVGPSFGATCPGAQTLTRNGACVVTIPNYITSLGIIATDACGVASVTQSPIAGTFFGANFNSTPVTITATDVNGNVQTCVFTVNFVDNTPPVITCPANMTVNTGVGNTNCSVAVNYALPTVTDNCAVFPNPLVINPVLVSGPASGGQFFVGVTTVTYRATDAAGNSATCSFTVTVQDNTAPTVQCTTNKNVSPNAAGCVFVQPNTSWDATAQDNCLIAPVIRYTATGATTIGAPGVTTLSGVTFNQGVTTVTVQAFDNAVPGPNASTTCQFTVTVVDNTVPVVTCPANVVVNAGLSGSPCSVVVPAAQLAPTVSPSPDFCPNFLEWEVTGATPNSSGLGTMPNFTFRQGVTTVAYRVSDAQGNSTTCSFTVTVNNNVTGAISGTATVQQNAITTSTITFTGAGGVAPYTFQYNVNGGPTQTITTVVGNSITVAQSNANTGTFTYTLTGVSATGGCPGTIVPPTTAVITVTAAGVPDLIVVAQQSSSQISAGGTIQEVFTVRNIGTGPTTGPVTFTVNRFAPGSGLNANINPAGSVTIGFDNFILHNNTEAGLWSVVTTASTFTFTYTGVIATGPAGGKNVGITVTRNPAPTQGAPGLTNQTATVQAGTGATPPNPGESPTTNNGVTVNILKN